MTADEQRELDQLKRIYEAAKAYKNNLAGRERKELEEAIRDYELNVRVKI